ncbi:hypothetical protein FHP29_21225 [Nocardioides albidus]|uniref:Uncharacterized protein n=1 Tax=Nocardioides albidus TaxID=1517589 RepID=A0A5C4VMM5_9ACTN|nr:hypothetical protein [Nocardioides albidus]TNM36646.1 hypothetical protein FHP29_21225 [Nocardioides albidus]
MSTTLPATHRGSLPAMVRIEAIRFLRHPLLLIGVLAAYGVEAWLILADSPTATDGEQYAVDLLSQPIIPAFFIGLTSLVVAARLTRSTEVAVEAMATAPGTEARRTLAVAGACVVPLVAGLGWLAEVLVLITVHPPHPHELWFGTVNDVYVWSILLALGPVACLGGALLGILVGRWLSFPGAPAVAVVLLVLLTMVGQLPYAYSEQGNLRVWVPWAMFHTGTMSDGKAWEGIPGYAQALVPGNPAAYLGYALALCALAVVGAVWHDRSARTVRLRLLAWGLVALAVALYLLAAFTGFEQMLVSEPLPLAA